jgi:hypothetical protein
MRFPEGREMTSLIGALSLFLIIAFSPEGHAVTPKTDKNITQQFALASYSDAFKEYREARMKARADIKIARAEYLAARRNAVSATAKAEAFARYRLARAAAWESVPNRPVRPTN